MGLVSPELSLDLKGSYVPETINGFLKQVSSISDASQRLRKLDEFVESLQDEMNKIHVFKRELPLSMLLLNDAILYVKQEATQYKTRNAHQPVLEEFVPLNKDSNSNSSEQRAQEQEQDKMSWMSSVQLWNADLSLSNSNNNNIPTKSHIKLASESLKAQDQDQDQGNQIVGDDDPCIMRAGSIGGRDFVPLLNTELRRSKVVEKEEDDDANVGRLSLLVPRMTNHTQLLETNNRPRAFHPKLGASRISTCTTTTTSSSSSASASASASARKQRRCWSPELHRRFVDALTHLGGPQVATPKQIRELMRVDGLTNDEVKSHLQKYRLHTRRLPNDSGTSTNKNGQGLSAVSTAQDQYSESSKPTSSQYASPEGPLQFPGGTSTTGGDSMEDEDDDKSETYSWKGHVHRPPKDDV